MTGLFGWIKAWGLGLFLATVALSSLSDFLSGFHAGLTGSNLKAVSQIDQVQHFFTLLVVSIVFGLAFYRLTAHRLEANRQRDLATMAAQAALRGKIAPHFIFNALNTLHAQIEADPREAQATTERLAQLFRQVIEVVDQATIPLKQELAFVEAYLGIEQARLGERLRVSIQIPEELESSEIPPLSLQVLVENAIKHGVGPMEQGGEVRIVAERQNGALHLWVEDPGTGFSAQKGTGTALDTLRQRLERPEDLVMGTLEGRHRVGFLWRQA
jgi:two-component system sensor histidine kinase AlgZ